MERTIGRLIVLLSVLIYASSSMAYVNSPQDVGVFGGEWPFPDAEIPTDFLDGRSYEVINGLERSGYFRIEKLPELGKFPYKFVIMDKCMEELGHGFADFSGNILQGAIIEDQSQQPIEMQVAAHRRIDSESGEISHHLYVRISYGKQLHTEEEQSLIYPIRSISEQEMRGKCKD